jgi:hypothetical protein
VSRITLGQGIMSALVAAVLTVLVSVFAHIGPAAGSQAANTGSGESSSQSCHDPVRVDAAEHLWTRCRQAAALTPVKQISYYTVLPQGVVGLPAVVVGDELVGQRRPPGWATSALLQVFRC